MVHIATDWEDYAEHIMDTCLNLTRTLKIALETICILKGLNIGRLQNLKIEVKNWVTEFGILSLQKQRGS